MALSIQTGSFQSILCGSRYFAGACGIVLATASIIVDLEVSVAPAGSASKPPAIIARKGDRLPLAPAFYRTAVGHSLNIGIPSTPPSNSKLADGCESLVSSLAHSPLKHIAGRCLS